MVHHWLQQANVGDVFRTISISHIFISISQKLAVKLSNTCMINSIFGIETKEAGF